MKNIRKFNSWEKTDCDQCGISFQVTRADPKKCEGEILCDDCNSYYQGYNDAKKEMESEIIDLNKNIERLFSNNWVGDSVLKNINTMRDQLYKNLTDQISGYWSGKTAYFIMIKGGFLIDGKSGSKKELTLIGESFLKDYEKNI